MSRRHKLRRQPQPKPLPDGVIALPLVRDRTSRFVDETIRAVSLRRGRWHWDDLSAIRRGLRRATATVGSLKRAIPHPAHYRLSVTYYDPAGRVIREERYETTPCGWRQEVE